LTVPANTTTFTFATGLKTGATYAATVLTQPSAPTEVCTVTNGTGTVASAPITSITVSCARVGQFVLVANSLGGSNNLGTVSAFAINSTTGALTAAPASPFALGTNDSDPTGIAVDENGHAYVTNTGSSNISLFDIGTNGALSFQGDYGTSGTVGAAIAVSASGTSAYIAGSSTANASSGSVSGFTITSSTGALTVTPNVPYSAGNPLVGIAIDPAAQLVFTTQGTTDVITAYLINSDGSLTGANGDPLSTGQAGNPVGVVTSPLGTSAGGFLYVANPAANSVSGYSYLTANAPPNASGNLLTPVPGTTQGSPGVFLTEGTSPEGIAIDPTGKYLYVTNFQDATVSSFSIDQSGTLTLIGTPVATGNINGANPTAGPIAVQVDPSGKFVYVVNQQDNSLSVFGSAAGTLTLLMTYQCDVGASAVAVE
jgi:6-phosphogluconolactonase